MIFRIKELRNMLGLTQQQFADRLGVSRNNIATYETRGGVSDSVISLICREFDVSEKWLRAGEGEMFIKKSRDHEIAAFVGEIMKGEGDMRRRFISVLARLSMEEWELLEKIARQFVSEDENS